MRPYGEMHLGDRLASRRAPRVRRKATAAELAAMRRKSKKAERQRARREITGEA